MRDPKRKVLLLVDNFSGHYLEKLEYSDLKIYFLPANTTSILQPCDAGIIACVKAQYRKLLTNLIVEHAENYRDTRTHS